MQNWPIPSPGHRGRAEELTLRTSQLQCLRKTVSAHCRSCKWASLEGMIRGKQDLLLVSQKVAWLGKRYFPLFHPSLPVAGERPASGVMRAESSFCSPPAAYPSGGNVGESGQGNNHGRDDPASCLPCSGTGKIESPFTSHPFHLQKTGKLAWKSSEWKSWLCSSPAAYPGGGNVGEPGQGCNHGRDDSAACLPCGGTGKVETTFTSHHFHLQKTRNLAWRSSEWESWSCPLLAAALGRIGPTPQQRCPWVWGLQMSRP